MAIDRCADPVASRRRIFWTTQLSCGEEHDCGFDCGVPGLKFIDTNDGQTFATNDWLRSLIINMLMTDGRMPDTACGYRPGSQGGHWSESYRDDGQPIGTLMRTAITPTGSVREGINQVVAFAQATLGRLVGYGVAKSVNVTSNYLGGSRVQIVVEVTGPAGESARVGISGNRIKNDWVWN